MNGGLGTLPQRLVICYLLVWMLPFPFDLPFMLVSLLPLPEAVASSLSLHEFPNTWIDPLVAVVGERLTGESVSFEMSGSGDSLAEYLRVLVKAVLAIFLTLVWWLCTRSRLIPPNLIEGVRVLVRYYLAWMMLGYGFAKVIPLQFGSVDPHRLIQAYGESSPMGLLWTFMAGSTGYQMFCGAVEVLGGALLLFRRTTLLGALVTFGAMVQVFALNMFFDVPVKILSFHLLLLALYLIVPDTSRLFALFIANAPAPARDQRAPWSSRTGLRRAMLALKVVLLVGLFYGAIVPGIGSWQKKKESAKHPLRGIYTVESFTMVNQRDEALKAERKRWIRLGLTPPHSGTIQWADGTTTRLKMGLDMDASTLALYDRELSEPVDDPISFKQPEEGLLLLEGSFEGEQIRVSLRRSEAESLLTSRGFRWINEKPFNR